MNQDKTFKSNDFSSNLQTFSLLNLMLENPKQSKKSNTYFHILRFVPDGVRRLVISQENHISICSQLILNDDDFILRSLSFLSNSEYRIGYLYI